MSVNSFFSHRAAIRHQRHLASTNTSLYNIRVYDSQDFDMAKQQSVRFLFAPAATVFLSSAFIMMLELVAGRLIARELGSSLYTWTSVIGVVLAGITIGNYLGGRIADKYPARDSLAAIFTASSIACTAVVVIHNLLTEQGLLWDLSWPVRIFLHVCIVFLVPSTLLGTISPVVAKLALDQGLPKGRTVGDIYACGAAGSIAGTLAAGFYLIPAMGSINVVWTVGVLLLIMGIIYRPTLRLHYVWLAVLACFMTIAVAPFGWAAQAGPTLALRPTPDTEIIYKDETEYCYVTVKRISKLPDKRKFIQDKLVHSEIVMGDINNLQYFYTRVYAALTEEYSRDKSGIATLTIGGGGYVYPRYIVANYPNSRVDVAEIDPGVTRAAIEAFGLEKNSPINTINLDARNYVDQLLQESSDGKGGFKYDFIYEDAINDYSVPYQLVTKQFNDKIAQILSDDGLYMMNLLDVFESGKFLGAVLNTLRQTFADVHVVTQLAPRKSRNTFVVIASKKKLSLDKIRREIWPNDPGIWVLSEEQIRMVIAKADDIILTDDYAPVENLLVPVVRRSTTDFLAAKFRNKAEQLRDAGKIDQSIVQYLRMIDIDPAHSTMVYEQVGLMLEQQVKLREAAEAFQQAIVYNEQAEIRVTIPNCRLHLGLILKAFGRDLQAELNLRKAAEEFQMELSINPHLVDSVFGMGLALAELGKREQADEYLEQAAQMSPYDVRIHLSLAQNLLAQQRYNQAENAIRKGIELIWQTDNTEGVTDLQNLLELVETQRQGPNQ